MDDLTTVLEVEGEVVYGLQPRQMELLDRTPLRGSTATHIGYGGAAGGGKSHIARAIAAVAAMKWPGSWSIIFRKTYGEVRDNHIVPFRQEVNDLDGRLYKWNASEHIVEWANGSRLIFGYLARDDDVFRYQGPQYDVMIFEEATHYSWFQVSWLTGNRLRANVDASRPFAVYPSNPGNIGHYWYKRLFIDRNFRQDLNEDPDDYAFVHAKLTDNRVLMDRDPRYIERLNRLPEPIRSQLRDGDWTAGTGLALPELRREVHLVEPFEPEKHWTYWGAYDWGFNHPFVYGLFCMDTDGIVYLVDSVIGRHLHDGPQAERIKDSVPLWDRAKFVHAGHDAWNEIRARGEGTPTTAETFRQHGIILTKANVSRISGLRNFRNYVTWSGDVGTEEHIPPRFRIMDTPSNLKVFECLESMVIDPDHMEDALKVDADDFGDGGDDPYDMTRYGLAARMMTPREPNVWKPKDLNVDTGLEKLMERINRNQNGRRGRRAFG